LFEDIDYDTFRRFAEYAYTGSYAVEKPDVVVPSTGAVDESQELKDCVENQDQGDSDIQIDAFSAAPSFPALVVRSESNSELYWSPKKDKKKAKKARSGFEEPDFEGSIAGTLKKAQLWNSFIETIDKNLSIPVLYSPGNRESYEDFTNLFLAHARMYVFADRYDIPHLAEYALHEVRRILASSILKEEQIEGVVKLMQYSYSNTLDLPDLPDSLRKLVTHYAACVVEYLYEQKSFQSLLEEHGTLSKDLVGYMVKRLE